MFSRCSLSCFFPPALFIISVSLALIFPFLTVAVSCLSHALQAWLYPNPRGNYCENISGYLHLSGYAPYQFLQLVCLKSWMKNDNTPVLTYKKQVGESYSQAIRSLTQVQVLDLIHSSCFLFLWSKASIKHKYSPEGVNRGLVNSHTGPLFYCSLAKWDLLNIVMLSSDISRRICAFFLYQWTLSV